MGSAKLIRSDVQYSVECEKNYGVQLVCKYLKAYETGGKKGIDKLYKEGTILGVRKLVFLRNVIELVPFHEMLSYFRQ